MICGKSEAYLIPPYSNVSYFKAKAAISCWFEQSIYGKDNTGIIIAYDISQAVEVAEDWDT